MPNTINIRRATLSDFAFIVESNVAMAWETEELALNDAVVRAGVGAVLADSSLGFYLVAEIDGNHAGQLMVTYEWSDWRNGLWWWIQSVYVRPEYRRRGVYTALHRHVAEAARSPPAAFAASGYTSSRKTPSPSRSTSPWICTPPATICTKSNSDARFGRSAHPSTSSG